MFLCLAPFDLTSLGIHFEIVYCYKTDNLKTSEDCLGCLRLDFLGCLVMDVGVAKKM